MSSASKGLGSLLRSAGVVFVGSVIGRLLGLLGELLIVRSLIPEEYGHIALAYTIVLLTGRLAMLGTNDGVTRLMSSGDHDEAREKVLQSGYVIALLGGVFCAVLLFAGRVLLANQLGDMELPRFLAFLLPFLIVYPLSQVSYSALRAQKQPLAAVLSRAVGARFIALSALGIALFFDLPLLGAIVYWIITPVTITIIAFGFLSNEFTLLRMLRFPDLNSLGRLWSFSWPLALSSSVFLLLSNLDVLMIGYFLESVDVGLYRAIQPLRQIAFFVTGAFTFLYLPLATEFFDEKKLGELSELYTISTKWIVFLTYPFVLVFVLFAGDVVRGFFGPEYSPAAPTLAVLVGGLFVRAVVGMDGDMIKAIDQPRIELYSAIVGVAANAVLNVLLVPQLGIIGAAIATVIGYAVYNAIEVGAIYTLIGAHPFSTDAAKPLVPTGLVAVGLAVATKNLRLGLPVVVFIGIALFVILTLSIILTKSLNEKDLFLIEQVERQTGLDLSWIKTRISA